MLPGRPLIVKHGSDETAVTLLHVQKLWHGGPHTQLLGIGRIDAADHGLRHPLQGFASQTPGDEMRQGFILSRGAPWQDQIA